MRKWVSFGRCLSTARVKEFRFLHWIAMKTFRATATSSRVFCLQPRLVFASSDSCLLFPVRSLSLSLSLSLGSALSGQHSMFVIESSWAQTGSLRPEQSAEKPLAVFFLFLFFSYVCLYYAIQFSIIVSELSSLHMHQIYMTSWLLKIFFVKRYNIQII